MANYLRAFRVDEGEREDGTLLFVASTTGVKRDGLDLDQDRWRLEHYERNPVFLWVHDYCGSRLPIGRTELGEVVEGALKARVLFDPEDGFAQEVRGKYERGFLNAVSVGWDDVDEEGEHIDWLEIAAAEKKGEPIERYYELLDISAVPVPGDPEALMERSRRGWEDLVDWVRSIEPGGGGAGEQGSRGAGEQPAPVRFGPGGSRGVGRGAKPPHSTAMVDEGTAWDGAAEVGKAANAAPPAGQAELLWRMHGWRDGGMDPEMREGYQLPHHLASGEVVWSGVAAAMAGLFQAATQIPELDRRGVYNHLERHYRQFGREAPEFRTLAELGLLRPDQVRGLFLNDEFSLNAADNLSALHAADNLSGLRTADNLSGLRAADNLSGLRAADNLSALQAADNLSGLRAADNLSALQGAYELLGKVIGEVGGGGGAEGQGGGGEGELLTELESILYQIPVIGKGEDDG